MKTLDRRQPHVIPRRPRRIHPPRIRRVLLRPQQQRPRRHPPILIRRQRRHPQRLNRSRNPTRSRRIQKLRQHLILHRILIRLLPRHALRVIKHPEPPIQHPHRRLNQPPLRLQKRNRTPRRQQVPRLKQLNLHPHPRRVLLHHVIPAPSPRIQPNKAPIPRRLQHRMRKEMLDRPPHQHLIQTHHPRRRRHRRIHRLRRPHRPATHTHPSPSKPARTTSSKGEVSRA